MLHNGVGAAVAITNISVTSVMDPVIKVTAWPQRAHCQCSQCHFVLDIPKSLFTININAAWT